MIEILDIRDKTEEDSKEHEECVQPEWKERLLNVFLGDSDGQMSIFE